MSATNPAESSRPTCSDPACHAATPTSAAPTATATVHFSPVEPRQRGTSCRSSSDGLTLRTRAAGRPRTAATPARRSPGPGATRSSRQAIVDLQQRREIAARRPAERCNTTPASATPSGAPGEPQQQHLRHIDREHLARGAPDALQDGDAADLLLHEHPRDARDADAAEDEDHQAHEAQVVLGARRGSRLIRPSFCRYERTPTKSLTNAFASSREQRDSITSARQCGGLGTCSSN